MSIAAYNRGTRAMSRDIDRKLAALRVVRSFTIGDRVIYTPSIYKGEPNAEGVYRFATIEAFEGYRARLSFGGLMADLEELEKV